MNQDFRPNIESNNGIVVSSNDSLGVLMLGFLAFGLLIALLRSQDRNRKLLEKSRGDYGTNSKT
jgi:hypothetical protein